MLLDVSNIIRYVTDEYPEVRGGWEQISWNPLISAIKKTLPLPYTGIMRAYMTSSSIGRANAFQEESKRELEKEGVEVVLIGRVEADPFIKKDLKYFYDQSKDVRRRRDPEKRKLYIVLVSGDADFLPELQAMNRDEIHLSVWAWENAMSRDLLRFADSAVFIESAVLDFVKP